MSRINHLAKEGSWILIGQLASVAGSLVMVRVLTEYLEPNQFGQLALGLTVVGLINQVVMGGVGNGISRFYSIAVEKNDVGGYLRASRQLLAYATAVVVVVGVALITGLLLLGYSRWLPLASVALVLALVSGYNSTLNGIQNAARQRAIVAFHGGLDSWLKIALAVGFMTWLGATSTAVAMGYVCSALLITGSQLFFMRRNIIDNALNDQIHLSWVSPILAYSLPFSTWGVFTWMQQSSDRWALGAFASTQDVGQYAVLFQLGYAPIALVSGMAVTFFGPILYQRSGDTTDHARNENVHKIGWRLTKFSLVVTMLGFIITFFFHNMIFRLLVAEAFREASYLLPWLVLAGGVFAAGQMLAVKLMSEMKSAAMTTAKIVTALTGVAFNIIGAKMAGLNGVVGAVVAFSIIYFIWMALLGHRCIQQGKLK